MKNIILDHSSKIVIIGFGRFGQVLGSILQENTKAQVVIVSRKKNPRHHSGLRFGTLKDIADADIIFPCVPISQFETVINKIAPMLKPNAVVIDVCSVKILPVEIMRASLPQSVQVIASHPMFGPDSYKIKKQLSGFVMVLSNVTAKKETYAQVKNFWKKCGLTIVELTPREHDKQMAMSLGYSYLIGKVGERMGIKKTLIDTYDFQLLLEQTEIVKSDSEELFFAMQTQNPFAKVVRENIEKVMNTLSNEIRRKEVKT